MMETEHSTDRICQELAMQIVKSMEGFLESFHKTMESNGGVVSTELLADFITAADRMNNQSSQKVAWVLMEHSQQPDVRTTAEGTLIRLIRNRCFETLDVILEDFVGYVSQLQTDLRQSIQALSDSRLRKALTGDESLSGNKIKRFKLPTASKEAAFAKVFEFFNNVLYTADLLMDYGCQKLGAGAADQPQVNRATELMHAALDEPLRKVISLLESHDMIKRKQWEEQHSAESATLNAVIAASSFKMDMRKSRMGAFVLSFVFVLPVGCFWVTGTHNLYLASAAGVSALVAMGCLIRGISTLAKHY